jgi:4-oxalocrotonate tautomerase
MLVRATLDRFTMTKTTRASLPEAPGTTIVVVRRSARPTRRTSSQVTLNAGRTVDQKRAFYKAIADGLHERLSLRREDVFISLVEVSKENWSFGNGEAQYAK